MAKIIRFGDDRHRQTQEALPWYVMDRLDEGERAEVEAHLADCAACRRELEDERELAVEVADLPLNADAGWAAVRSRMSRAGRGGSRPRLGRAFERLLSRPTRLGWLVAAQLLLAVAAGLAYTALPHHAPAEYHALSAQPAYAAGNVIAIFRPDISEERLRTMLVTHRARVVDGPTASGAYVLRVPDGARASILAELQQDKDVVLAQPIDAEPGQ